MKKLFLHICQHFLRQKKQTHNAHNVETNPTHPIMVADKPCDIVKLADCKQIFIKIPRDRM